MMLSTKRFLLMSIVIFITGLFSEPITAQQTLKDVKQKRGLSNADILAAVKTFMPRGGRDEYFGFAGTGNSGTMIVYGIPSMRIYKYVGVFSPEPWQGYGYDDESSLMLKKGSLDDKIDWYGDMRYPALSETNGNYDGKHLFYSDGANSRIALIDLKDFETKQVLSNPLFISSYPEAAVTPNTEYVIQSSQFPSHWAGDISDLAKDIKLANPKKFHDAGGDYYEYDNKFRSGITFWKFEEGSGKSESGHEGRILKELSFTLELPPFTLGYYDVGKFDSDGYLFGAAKKNGKNFVYVVKYDNLHLLKNRPVNDATLVSFHDALDSNDIVMIQVPSAAKMVKVTPKGKYVIAVSDTIRVFDVSKIIQTMKNKAYSVNRAAGIPVVLASKVEHGELGLGNGVMDVAFDFRPDIAYASVFNDKKIVRWNYKTMKRESEITVDFKPGQLMVPQGLSASPHSNYLTAVDKEGIYKNFLKTGPVRPSFQHLIDISGNKMHDIYTMSLPQCNLYGSVAVLRTTIKPIIRYPVGTNSRTGEISAYKTLAGKEKIERKGNRVHVFGTLIRSHITPEIIEVNQGDVVTIHLTNLELAEDETHGFTVDTYGKHASFEPGKTASVTFVADKAGAFPYYCTEFCSALHLEMEGIMLVKPKGFKGKTGKGNIQLTRKELLKYKSDYEAKLKVISQTQDVINGVVKWLKENHYENHPYVKALVQDAVAQLTEGAKAKKKYESFAAKGSWKDAFLWAEQYFQYQVKAADAGLRAQKLLKEKLQSTH